MDMETVFTKNAEECNTTEKVIKVERNEETVKVIENDYFIESGNVEKYDDEREDSIQDTDDVGDNSKEISENFNDNINTTETFGQFPLIHDNVPETFPCPFCDKCFKRRPDVKRHINLHTGAKSYSCNLCFESFGTTGHLESHRVKVHALKKDIICTACFESFKTKKELSQHMKNAHSLEVNTWSCELCNIKFDTKKEVQNHDKTVHGRKEGHNSCLFCDKVFSFRSDLKRHERKHTGFKPFSCNVCEKSYQTRNQLTKHLLQHKQIETGEKYFQCGECTSSFTSSSHMKRHLRRVHKAEVPWTCKLCLAVFPLHEDFIAHKEKDHGIVQLTEEEKPKLVCDYCGKKWKYLSEYRRHLYIHIAEKIYKCDVCEKQFKYEINLKKHTRFHCKGKLDAIDSSTKEFIEARKKEFIEYRIANAAETENSEGESLVTCRICSRVCSKDLLAKHMSLHLKDKFACKNCEAVFEAGEKCEKHSQILIKGEVECEFCEMAFKNRRVLQQHWKIHVKEVPFECDTCGRQFKNSFNLNRHTQIHSEVEKLSCNYCSRTYTCKDSLKRHLRKKHERDLGVEFYMSLNENYNGKNIQDVENSNGAGLTYINSENETVAFEGTEDIDEDICEEDIGTSDEDNKVIDIDHENGNDIRMSDESYNNKVIDIDYENGNDIRMSDESYNNKVMDIDYEKRKDIRKRDESLGCVDINDGNLEYSLMKDKEEKTAISKHIISKHDRTTNDFGKHDENLKETVVYVSDESQKDNNTCGENLQNVHEGEHDFQKFTYIL